MEEIISTLSKNIKVNCCVKLEELAVNIWLIQSGRKPCVLLDFCKVQIKQFLIICKQLLGDDGILLKLEQDYFLGNKTSLIAQLTSSLKKITKSSSLPESSTTNVMRKSKALLVDITQHTHTILDNFPASILNCIEHMLHCLTDSASDYIQIQDLGPEVNLCTMFGLLLDYPIVYYFDPSKDVTSLNNEDLVVFTLQYNQAKVTSFSIPHKVYTENADVNKYISNWISDISDCSFDIEKAFDSDTKNQIVLKICDKDFILVKNVVNLPFVAL